MKTTTISILILMLMGTLQAQDFEKIIDLKGRWRFTIGDNKEWANPNYNDQEWENIMVPSPWEDQGFNSYDGFAWYRKSFNVAPEFAQKKLYLKLGYIDDVDEVYINGQLIGISGSMPPKYNTAYNALRTYYIPSNILKYGKANLLSVRVYDSGISGGIVSGDIGIFARFNSFPLDYDLQGIWKFKTGDNENYIDPLFNDNNWPTISVPSPWEDQGYQHHDGFAWYRKKFLVKDAKPNEKYVVVLGKIDDLEEVYLNGQFIGPQFKIEEAPQSRFDELRYYYISGSLLQNNKYNVLSIRVKDTGGRGGIYEGHVGIARLKNFLQYWRSKK